MGGYTLPVATSQDPNDPSQANPYAMYGYNGYGGFSPYSGVDTSSQNWGSAIGAGGQDVSPNASISDITSANRNQISDEGNTIAQQGANELNYYSPLQQADTSAENSALNQLQATPGFTPAQSSQINADYSQYNTAPSQYGGITDTLNAGTGAEGADLNQYQADLGAQLGAYSTNLGGEVGNYDTWTGGANSAYGTNVNTATSGLGAGLQAAQGQFGGLNTAVNNTALGFDPNGTEQQLTPAQQQAMVTAAGTTVGNQFQSAEDTLMQQAAAQGNTSPEALAAMRQQLVTQGAATAGDTMTQAGIAAEQAGFQQASSIEQQREGATQTQAGLQATAATTEEAAAQAAAAQAGQTNVAAQENIGAENVNVAANAGTQGINAANTIGAENVGQVANYGQFATGEANTMTGQQYNNALTQAQMQYSQGTDVYKRQALRPHRSVLLSHHQRHRRWRPDDADHRRCERHGAGRWDGAADCGIQLPGGEQYRSGGCPHRYSRFPAAGGWRGSVHRLYRRDYGPCGDLGHSHAELHQRRPDRKDILAVQRAWAGRSYRVRGAERLDGGSGLRNHRRARTAGGCSWAGRNAWVVRGFGDYRAGRRPTSHDGGIRLDGGGEHNGRRDSRGAGAPIPARRRPSLGQGGFRQRGVLQGRADHGSVAAQVSSGPVSYTHLECWPEKDIAVFPREDRMAVRAAPKFSSEQVVEVGDFCVHV